MDKKSILFRFALLGFHYISDLFINNQLRLAVVLYAQRAPLRMAEIIYLARVLGEALRFNSHHLTRKVQKVGKKKPLSKEQICPAFEVGE